MKLFVVGAILSFTINGVRPVVAQLPGVVERVAVQVKPDTLQEADVDLLASAGIHLVRFGIYYYPDFDRQGQKAPEWARYDRLFQILEKRHIRVLMTAFVPPETLREQLKGQSVPNIDGKFDTLRVRSNLLNDLDVLVRNSVQRYGHSIAAIELWNEPENRRFWSVAPELGSIASAMDGVCARAKGWPQLPLLGFGLVLLPGGDNSSTTLFDSMKKSGATSCLTAVSGHFYREHAELVIDELRKATEYVQLPVAVTELGASSMSTTRTESQQADLVSRVILSSLIAKSPLISMYEWKDSAEAMPEREKHFGALRSDSTKKPLFYAIQNFLPLYQKAESFSGSCTEEICQVAMRVDMQEYQVFWNKSATEVPLSKYLRAEEIDSKLLRSADDFYTSSPQEITLTQSPLLVHVVAHSK
ncbi:MAG: hypothetical protein JWM43_3760 [Acidobacteriaceae bacterium]|nr:hypothetical protein [Acidobacteriaceae bacterium]